MKMPNFRYDNILWTILFGIFEQLISINVYPPNSSVTPPKKKKFNEQQKQKPLWRIFPLFERRKLYR